MLEPFEPIVAELELPRAPHLEADEEIDALELREEVLSEVTYCSTGEG